MKLSMEECMQMIKENDGDLNLTGRSDITELPEELIVPKNCILKGTSIKHTPNNFIVGRNLHCVDSKIKVIGEHIIVGESLYCSKYIEDLPDDLIVGRSLHLLKSKIKKVPEKIRVGEDISPNLYFIANQEIYINEIQKVKKIKSKEYITGKGIRVFGFFYPTENPISLEHGCIYYPAKIKGKNIFFDGVKYYQIESLDELQIRAI